MIRRSVEKVRSLPERFSEGRDVWPDVFPRHSIYASFSVTTAPSLPQSGIDFAKRPISYAVRQQSVAEPRLTFFVLA